MDLFAHDRRQLDRIERLLIAIARNSNLTISTEKEIMASVADIQAEADDVLTRVTANTNALDAVKTLIQSQSDQINTLNQELKDAIANGADPAALQAISDKLTAVTQATDAQAAAEAALANTTVTPPAGTTTPPPPPVAGPVITSIDPAVGDEAGGTAITITGTGFAATDSVSIGGNPAVNVVVNSDTSIGATTPAGTGDATVVVNDGSGNSSAPGVFRYAPAPVAAPAA